MTKTYCKVCGKDRVEYFASINRWWCNLCGKRVAVVHIEESTNVRSR